MTPTEIVPWAISVCALVWAIYARNHDKNDKVIDELLGRVRDLELDLARLQSPLMKQVQDLLSAGLHHPDPAHVRQDALLERLDRAILTPQEIPELVSLLDKQISSPHTPPDEVEAAKALKAIMPLVVKERVAVVETAAKIERER